MQIEPASANNDLIIFEIFLQEGFSEYELSAIVTTLQTANRVLAEPMFDWNIVSDTPGLLNGSCGTIARANPAIFDHYLGDFLIIIGGNNCNPNGWLRRVRAMQRHKRPVAILSEAATAYIRTVKTRDRSMATHWRDVSVLKEEGDFPSLTTRCAEISDGIITSAGTGFTTELTIGLIAKFMGRGEVDELASLLLVKAIRDNETDQPKSARHFLNLFEPKIEEAIRIMEENIAEPLSTYGISAQVGISLRQLERLFDKALQMSPGRYYRQIRVKEARIMVTGSNLDMIEIATATGFGSSSTLSRAYRKEYEVSPTADRANRRYGLVRS